MSACRLLRNAEGEVTGCVTLTHTHEDTDPNKPITSVLCGVCLNWTPVQDLYVDTEGQKWDYCKRCENR